MYRDSSTKNSHQNLQGLISTIKFSALRTFQLLIRAAKGNNILPNLLLPLTKLYCVILTVI